MTIAMKLVSSLKRLKSRRTRSLCKNRAMMRPAANKAANAINAQKRDVMSAYLEQWFFQQRETHRNLVCAVAS